MARGFESKAVAEQQEAALDRPAESEEGTPDPALLARRRRLELARADVRRRLEVAQAEAHRQILERALAAIEEDLASLR
jgi:Flp pilus assembly protein TadD